LQYKSVASTICTRKQQKHSKNLHDEEQTSPSIKKLTFGRATTHPHQALHFGKVKDEKQDELKK
jgi:hypothetical protein